MVLSLLLRRPWPAVAGHVGGSFVCLIGTSRLATRSETTGASYLSPLSFSGHRTLSLFFDVGRSGVIMKEYCRAGL